MNYFFLLLQYAIAGRVVEVDLTRGKQPEEHIDYKFDVDSWVIHLHDFFREPIDFNVVGWDPDFVEVKVEHREYATGNCYSVMAKYKDLDLIRANLLEKEVLQIQTENKNQDFIELLFWEHLPGVADLSGINFETWMTPREMEAVTRTKSYQWILFAYKIAFEKLHANTMKTIDMSEINCRSTTIKNKGKNPRLKRFSTQAINILSGREIYSYYQTLGFTPLHPAAMEQYREISDAVCEEHGFCGGNRKKFKEFQQSIEYEQEGNPFRATDACQKEFEFYRSVSPVVKTTDLPDFFELPFSRYQEIARAERRI